MSILFDVILLLVFAVFCITGFVKGFVKYAVGMIGSIAAIIISFVVSSAVAEPIYEKYVKQELRQEISSVMESENIQQLVEQELEKQGLTEYIDISEVETAISAGGDAAENLGEILFQKGADSQVVEQAKESFREFFDETLPESFKEFLPKNYSKLSDSIEFTDNRLTDCVCAVIRGDNYEAACLLEESVAMPLAIWIIKTVVFIVCYIVIEIIIKIVLLISGMLTAAGAISFVNRLGGMALGFAKGCLYGALVAFAVSSVINLTGNSLEFLNEQNMENTFLFKYFFDYFYK